MKPSNILLPKVELFSIPLGDQSYGLTYEMSDMDVMSDRIPKPLSYDPNNGLYLIDPGSAQASQPILHRFAVDGKRVYQNSLLQALRIQNPVAYLANNLFVDENGDVTLLSSRSYNAELDRNESFILATFNRKGDLSKFVEIPELQQGYPIFRSREGYLWVYNRKDSEGAWSIYNAKGKLERQIKANNNATLLPDGILLVFLDERHAALYDHDGKNYSTIIQGNIIRSDVIVQGRGWFFGLLKYPDDEWKKNPKGDLEQSMTIQVIKFDPKSRVISPLASQPLSPNVFDAEEIPKHFEYYALEMMSFDAEGNFYLVARYGPKQPHIRVFRRGLNPAALKP